MQWIATYMSVKPGMEARYREEHRTIWPEVVAGISRYGHKPTVSGVDHLKNL